MLEVTESDFSKNLYEMEAVEEAAVADYTKAVKEFEVGKVVKDQAIKYKTKEYIDADKAAGEETTDREGTQSELDAINESLAQLEGMCIGKAQTYDDRVAKRNAEIADLKESLDAIETQAADAAAAEPAAEPAAEAAAEPVAEAAAAPAAEAAAEPAAEAAPAASFVQRSHKRFRSVRSRTA